MSVVIPLYRGERFIRRAVASALAQTFSNTEIVLVNDGSPDNSRREIESFLSRSNIKYIEKENGGVASARNTALRVSEGKYIAFLDQDDLWYPRRLERQVGVLESQADVALVHADVTYIGVDDKALPHDPYFPAAVEGHCFARMFMANPVMTCTVLVRRSAIDEAGGFDEGIRFSDDYDLWLRIARRHALAYVDEPLAMYRLHSANESKKTAGIVAATMQVLHKALNSIPDCAELVGEANVRARFAQLECMLSRHYFGARDWPRFAWHWMRAFSKDRAITLQTGLPPAALSTLRWYSRKFGLR